MNDIELCYKCNDDPATLNNMKTLIIPSMLKLIEESKMMIRSIPEDEDIMYSYSQRIINFTRAIRAFYKRFPHIDKIVLRPDVLKQFDYPVNFKRKEVPVERTFRLEVTIPNAKEKGIRFHKTLPEGVIYSKQVTYNMNKYHNKEHLMNASLIDLGDEMIKEVVSCIITEVTEETTK